MTYPKSFVRIAVVVVAALMVPSCGPVWNDPYPVGEREENILYAAFSERPKHLDPVQSFSEDEATFLYQIMEPPLQYHYLKRPYTLQPGVAEDMPALRYYDKAGNPLPDDAPAERVARSEYDITIQKGVLYQPHPAFAVDPDGRPLYLRLTEKKLVGVRGLSDFPETGTRELEARDFVYQLKRLAHPHLHSPIFELMAEYLPGLKTLQAQLIEEATRRPGWIDLDRFDLPGVEILDRHTYRITLEGVYPQFVYWLTMPFFGPIPREADHFFSQQGMAERNLTLDWWPVGTGPYMLVENNPNSRMVLARNPYFRGEFYPCEGEASDMDAGFLDDCGGRLPFIDKAVFTREREGIPAWNKFLQGYYDASGVSAENFDQAVTMTTHGDLGLSDEMAERGIHLNASVSPTVFYLGFNMRDPLVGGDGTPQGQERARKLRQAISIILNMEEFISIFLNGRGVAAMHPIPPGMFGAREGKAGINPVVYEWRDGKAMRRGGAEVRRLLAEAGYPNGRNRQTGEPLVINLDTTSTGVGDKARSDWFAKQLRAYGIQFVVRPTDWNRFQDKIRTGNAQLFFLGWNADYPDPENLLFLLYGPQGKVKYQGQNAANYENEEYDRLFEQMKVMPNGVERQQVIDRMIAILQHDAPWVFGFHTKAYVLQHGWLYNRKSGVIIRNGLKYQRIDPQSRAEARLEWNRPVTWPLGAMALLLIALVLPAAAQWWRRERARA